MSGDEFQQSDFPVPGKSNRELREIASRLRQLNGLAGRVVDIVKCLTAGWLMTIDGRQPKKRLFVEVLPDAEMGKNDGLTVCEKDRIVMQFKESVWLLAQRGDGRARFTLCHEYAHAILNHRKGALARASGVNKAYTRPKFIATYESAEHQADYVAARTLIDIELIAEGETAEGIACSFQVSLSCAQNVLREKNSSAKSPVVSEGWRKLADSLSGKVRFLPTDTPLPSSSPVPRAEAANHNRAVSGPSTEICPDCGQVHVPDPIGGSKSACVNSGRAGNFHPEGDDPWDEDPWTMEF